MTTNAMTTAKKSAATSNTGAKNTSRFSAEERSAMQARAGEVRRTSRARDKAAAEAQACLDAIAEMSAADRELAERVHELVTEAAPELSPKTWYGMPAYAHDGKLVCYFKSASKFKTRYAQLGFEERARLDDGTMWPTVFAVTEISDSVAGEITRLLRRAVG